jgi:hypothetical protein
LTKISFLNLRLGLGQKLRFTGSVGLNDIKMALHLLQIKAIDKMPEGPGLHSLSPYILLMKQGAKQLVSGIFLNKFHGLKIPKVLKRTKTIPEK